jgi:hypothetical protein
MREANFLSIGASAAFVNVLVAICALIWQLRREPRIERGASLFRIFMIGLGIILIVYPNLSRSAPDELVLVGGALFLAFLAAPKLSVWCVRLIQRKRG